MYRSKLPLLTVVLIWVGLLQILGEYAAVAAPSSASARYSSNDVKLINQLRSAMGNKLYLDYMKSDDYLMSWLRAAFMDMQGAKSRLDNSIRWRKENKIDGILDEDLSPISQTFKINFGYHDKDGRPLLIVYFGPWDIRKAVISGHSDKLQRYLCQQLELSSKTVREVNTSTSTGTGGNVTDIIITFDATGYNLRQHGCLLCIPEYIHFINNLESHYPLLTHKIIIVNAPTVFQQLYRIILPLFHPETAKGISVYDVDKNHWRKELLKIISADQLPKRLGGTAKN